MSHNWKAQPTESAECMTSCFTKDLFIVNMIKPEHCFSVNFSEKNNKKIIEVITKTKQQSGIFCGKK